MSNAPKESKRAARERLAEERKVQAAKDRRRETIQRGAIIGVVLAVVVGIGIAVQLNRSSVDESGENPQGTDDSYGVVVGSGPVKVDLYEDFQCPVCADFEEAGGREVLADLVADDSITLVYHPASFLDDNLGNDSSARAANAFGCAVEEGKAVEFHDVVFANQPATEGDGWTDEQLIEFGADIGLTGSSFESCVTDQEFSGWVSRVQGNFVDEGITGTPTVKVDGEQVEGLIEELPGRIRQAVEDAS